MAASSEKMIRKQFLVSPSTAKRLERLAAARGTSASEIVRQAIDSYDVNVTDPMDSKRLIDLVSARLNEAIKSTRRTRHRVARTLRALDHSGSNG